MKQFNKLTLFFIAFTIWMTLSMVSPTAGFVGLIIGIVFYWHFTKKTVEVVTVTKEEQQTEAQVLIDSIQEEKKLVPINTSLLLEDKEYAFLSGEADLFEPRAIRNTVGGGIGVRVAKGVHVGGFKSQSESRQELREIDSGTLTITNKRIVFRGTKESRVMSISKIVELKMHADAIELASTGKQKNSIFTVGNPYTWNVLLFVLSKVKDPLDFSEIGEIDIALS